MSVIQVNLMADSQGGSVAPISSVMRNRLIDAGFTINQRGYVSGTALSAGTYAHDRFKAGASGCTYTFSQGSAGVPIVITITAGSLQQVIEGANMGDGGTYVLSWTGTAQAKFNGGSFGNSPLAVTGIVAGANTTIEFGTGTCSFPQLEKGTQATSFEYRQIGTELALCQRYFIRMNSGGVVFAQFANGICNSVNSGQGFLSKLPVTMRISPPTVTFSNLRVFDGNAAAAVSSISSVGLCSNPNGLGFDVACSASFLTAGRPGTLQGDNNTAAFLAADAEL